MDKKLKEILSHFRSPPPGYGVIHWWILDGDLSEKRIMEEINWVKNLGISNVLIAAGYGVNPRYLSEEWFNMVKFAVKQAKERKMFVWLADEGGYPSGFAGETFNTKYPELLMKALLIGERIDVEDGQVIELEASKNIIGALAVNLTDNSSIPVDVSSGRIRWAAPKGRWQIWLIQNCFCSSPTRYVHHPTGAKDTTFSLCDYLNPKAVEAFLNEVHENYKKHIGPYFGHLLLGFFGDEPDYSIPGIPWTEGIFEEFERIKGYDVRPFVPFFFLKEMPEEAKRARADYWDVWSRIFSETFFKMQFEWCEKNGLLYTVHLNHEDDMRLLTRSEGDFFRCMRYVHVPAIDVIWRQIWMDKVADFPKLASSVAHIYGRRFVLSESFAVYGTGLSLEQAKWVIDYQLARGVTLILTGIFMPRSFKNPQSVHFARLIQYVNRASFLLSLGQPCAKIALYYPSSDLWLGNYHVDKKVWDIARQLLERQLDFDFIDEGSVISVLEVSNGVLKNLSGQLYQAVIIPPVNVLSQRLLNRLREFAESGGRVIFLGYKPFMVVKDSFLAAEKVQVNLRWAICLPEEGVTSRVIENLPEPDVLLNMFVPSVKYVHRRWRNIDIYFFFNESENLIRCKATVCGKGSVQEWDAELGRIISLKSKQVKENSVEFSLELEPFEAKFILVGPLMPEADAEKKMLEPLSIVLDLSGDWIINIDGKRYVSELKY